MDKIDVVVKVLKKHLDNASATMTWLDRSKYNSMLIAELDAIEPQRSCESCGKHRTKYCALLQSKEFVDKLKCWTPKADKPEAKDTVTLKTCGKNIAQYLADLEAELKKHKDMWEKLREKWGRTLMHWKNNNRDYVDLSKLMTELESEGE